MQRPLWSLDGKVFYDYPTWVREPVPGDTPDELHEAIRERVPAGATLLMATNQPAVASIEGYDARPFPIAPDGSFRGQPAEGAEVVRELEREHEAGARYVVFPKLQLWALQYPLEDLQQHLESTYSSVLRDGALGVVFELD